MLIRKSKKNNNKNKDNYYIGVIKITRKKNILNRDKY